MAIVTAGEKGRNAFVGNRGIHYLCETVIGQSFCCEDGLKVSELCFNLIRGTKSTPPHKILAGTCLEYIFYSLVITAPTYKQCWR